MGQLWYISDLQSVGHLPCVLMKLERCVKAVSTCFGKVYDSFVSNILKMNTSDV